jgi:putative peptide zinc metalloprotease protein
MHPFEGDAAEPVAVCEVPDSSGRPRRYLVPRQLCELLCICNGELERNQALAAMAEKSKGRYSTRQIEQLAGDFLIPRQLLLDSEASATTPIAARRLDRYLFFKVRFLRRGIVLPIAKSLQWLFQPLAWKCFIALILASHLWFYLFLTHGQAPRIDSLPNSSLPWLILILSMSAMLHEFGHAAALTRFGGRNAEIGAGVYIGFLALFVDLSEAWRLTNRQRVIVDLGGMYFQGIVLIFLAAAFAITGEPVWACCFLLTDIQIAVNLNPLLRLDGYWALADAIGIPNLRRRAIQHVLIHNRRQDTALQTSGRTRKAVRIYLAAALVFSTYLIYILSVQCFSIVRNYPDVLGAALQSWRAGSVFDALSSSAAALWRGMILLGIAVLLFRAVSWIIQQARWGSARSRTSSGMIL